MAPAGRTFPGRAELTVEGPRVGKRVSTDKTCPVIRHRYRLRMSPTVRVLRVSLFSLCVLFLASGLATGSFWFSFFGVAGAVVALAGVRMMLGPVVVVDDANLTIQPYWPIRRRVPWYRIDHAEVVPGTWCLLIEMNSGERFELPCVSDFDDLYEQVEGRRKALDVS
jgi:hypothetical protein